MRSFRFVTVDVFTERRFGGNPLAVFPDARGMTDAEMQAVAREFNLSETTFVLPPEDAANTARVRIFNPVAEMPFAGHPNVGTAFVLRERAVDGVLRFEEIAGLVEVRLDADGGGATIAAPQPLCIGPTVAPEAIAACAGIEASGILTARHPPTIISDGGNPRVTMEVTPDALAAAQPETGAFRRALASLPELGGRLSLYLYRRDGEAIRARMFAPLSGTPEDPATGSAATPLAGFLLHLAGGERIAFDIHQGVEMGRPSLLRAAARRAAHGIRATVGGRCVDVLWGEIAL